MVILLFKIQAVHSNNNPFLSLNNNLNSNNTNTNNLSFQSNNSINYFNNNSNNNISFLNNNNLFNNNGNSNENKNNSFNSINNNTISFGFSQSSTNSNSTNPFYGNNLQNNNLSSNSYNNNFNNNTNFNNNISVSQNLQNENNNFIIRNNEINNIIEEKKSLRKSVPLSTILSLRFQSEDFLEEVLIKLNEDKDDINLLKNAVGKDNCTEFIIDSILSSKTKKERKKKYEKENELNKKLKKKKLEEKIRMERIKEEEKYKKFLKEFYKKHEMEELKKSIKSTSQKTRSENNLNKIRNSYNSSQFKNHSVSEINNMYESVNNNSYNNKEKDILHNNIFNENNNLIVNNINIKNINYKTQFIKEKNRYDITRKRNSQTVRNSVNSLNSINTISSIDIIEETNEEESDDINIKETKYNEIVYNIDIKVYDQENKKIFNKNLILNKKTHYFLNLDKLYYEIIETLRILNIECKYGLKYFMNNYELKENVGKINLLEYEVLGYINTEKDYYKNIDMGIEIIDEKDITEKEALLNPQLHFKNPKHYFLVPNPTIIFNSNLFKYDKGLEILFQYMSVIFNDKETYDITGINIGELCYDGDTEIYFDDENFIKEFSSMKKLWDIRIGLIYRGIGSLYEDNPKINNIIFNYLNKRYMAEMIDINNKDKEIFIVTKFENLFFTLKESQNLYNEFKKNFSDFVFIK